MRKFSKGICTLVIGVTLSTMNYSVFAAMNDANVMGGENRYSTAGRIAECGWKYGTDTIVLVNGEGFVDALAATPFAREQDSPILLTRKDSIPSETKEVISRLGVSKVIVIGGEHVVSNAAVKELKAMNLTVERIFGNNRYETSAEIARKMESADKVAVVNGIKGLADAISIAAPAAGNNMAIILSDGNNIVAGRDVIDNVSEKYVIGGSSVIKDGLVKSIGATRIYGNNRSATNVAILNKFYKDDCMNKLYVARNGSGKETELVDALAIGPLAARENAPVMLVGNELTTEQKNYLAPRECDNVIQVGYAVNKNVVKDIVGDLLVVALPKEEKNKLELKRVNAVDGDIVATLTTEVDKVSLDDFYITKSIEGGKVSKVKPISVSLREDKVTVDIKIDNEEKENWNKKINYFVRYKDGKPKNSWFEIIKNTNGPSVSVSEVTSVTRNMKLPLKVTCTDKKLKAITVTNNGRVYSGSKKGEYLINLLEGNNVIKVVAVDDDNNETVIIKNVNCDLTKPKITSDIKEESQEETITFNVKTDEPAEVSVKNGDYSANSLGGNKFSVKLKEGYNDIIIKAIDRAGNSEVKSYTVKYIAPITPSSANVCKQGESFNVVELKGLRGVSNYVFIGKTIKLKGMTSGNMLEATYIDKSFRNGTAKFKLNSGNFNDAEKYTITAEWGDFKNCDFIAKIGEAYPKKAYILTREISESERVIKIEAEDQYGEKINLSKLHLDNTDESKIRMVAKVGDKKLNYTVFENDKFRITDNLKENEKVNVEFINEKDEVIANQEFVVKKGEPSKQTTIEDLNVFLIDGEEENPKEGELVVGETIKLTANVKDQYGNPLKEDKAKIKWTIEKGNDLIENLNESNHTEEGFKLKVNKAGDIVIRATIDNGKFIRYSSKVGFKKLTSISENVIFENAINKEPANSSELKPNEGARINPSDVKFIIRNANSRDISLKAVRGKGTDSDKVFVQATTNVAGEYQFKIYVQASKSNGLEKDIESGECTIKTTVRNEAEEVKFEPDFKVENLPVNKDTKRKITFLNKHGEKLDVKANELNISEQNNLEIKMYSGENGEKSVDKTSTESITYLGFNAKKADEYEFKINVGEEGKDIIVKAYAAGLDNVDINPETLMVQVGNEGYINIVPKDEKGNCIPVGKENVKVSGDGLSIVDVYKVEEVIRNGKVTGYKVKILGNTGGNTTLKINVNYGEKGIEESVPVSVVNQTDVPTDLKVEECNKYFYDTRGKSNKINLKATAYNGSKEIAGAKVIWTVLDDNTNKGIKLNDNEITAEKDTTGTVSLKARTSNGIERQVVITFDNSNSRIKNLEIASIDGGEDLPKDLNNITELKIIKGKEATIKFKAKDQYGEDVSSVSAIAATNVGTSSVAEVEGGSEVVIKAIGEGSTTVRIKHINASYNKDIKVIVPTVAERIQEELDNGSNKKISVKSYLNDSANTVKLNTSINVRNGNTIDFEDLKLEGTSKIIVEDTAIVNGGNFEELNIENKGDSKNSNIVNVNARNVEMKTNGNTIIEGSNFENITLNRSGSANDKIVTLKNVTVNNEIITDGNLKIKLDEKSDIKAAKITWNKGLGKVWEDLGARWIVKSTPPKFTSSNITISDKKGDFSIKMRLEEEGTIKYIIKDLSDGEILPNESELTETLDVKNGSGVINKSGLKEKQEYTIYCMAEDLYGNKSGVISYKFTKKDFTEPKLIDNNGIQYNNGAKTIMVTFDEEIKSPIKSKVKIAGSNKNVSKVEIDKENKCRINIILNKALELGEDTISFDEGFVVDLNSNRNEKIEQIKI